MAIHARPLSTPHARRFHIIHRRRRAAEALAEQEADEVDWDSLVIRGTCQNLEKSYFRLTSAPDPATVRPEAVVRRAYERLVGLLAGGAVNYFYALDQFKVRRVLCCAVRGCAVVALLALVMLLARSTRRNTPRQTHGACLVVAHPASSATVAHCRDSVRT